MQDTSGGAGGSAAMLEPLDDLVHPVTNDPWETETCWFSFYVPDDRLTGYLYVVLRPNLGICAGGAVVWDDTAQLPWEIPHFDFQWHLPTDLKPGASFNKTPVGVGVRVLEPLSRYHVTYAHDDLAVDMTFTAVGEPHVPAHGEPPFAEARHLDQLGHVVGTLVRGETTTPIDCLAMRDRSWGPRDDRRPGRFGYTLGAATPDHGFLSYSRSREQTDDIFAGYLLRDGVRARLISGQRRVERDPAHGGPTRVTIEATDERGRSFTAEGRAVNRLCFTPYPRMLNWTTTLDWVIDGQPGRGEDQDVWPIQRWARHRAATVEATR